MPVRTALTSRPALIVLTALLAADLLYWGGYSPRHAPLLGLCCLPASSGRTYHPAIPRAVVVRDGGALRILDIHDDEAHRIETAPLPGQSIVADLIAIPQPRTLGLLAPVVATHDHTMRVLPRTAPLPPQDLAAIRPLYASFIAKAWPRSTPDTARYAAMLAAGDGLTSRILWPGVAHDVLALPVLAAWLLAVSRLLDLEGRRLRRREAALADGRCPRCGYNIRALLRRAEPRCPECGDPLA